MNFKITFTLLYSLHLIATALINCIQAQELKMNALGFCTTMAVIIIAGAVVYQLGKRCVGTIVISVATALVLGFYVFSFLSAPDKDANWRIGAIILSSIAELMVCLFPRAVARD